MAWLESLGKVTHDYIQKTMSFVRNEQTITLTASAPAPRRISAHTLVTSLQDGDIFEVYELLAADVKLSSPPPQALTDLQFPEKLPVSIRKILERWRHVFDVPVGLPSVRAFDHRIHLHPDAKPVNVRPYRYPYFQKNEIEKQVKDMLDTGVIRPSHSPFSSPVLLVRKKDGSFRFCIDYRALNKATVPDHFPIPTADELFDELGEARYFTKLDLRSGYHQLRMHSSDIYKTAFRTHDGHYEFLVMPFGLTNAPSTFQAAMNDIFRPLLRKFVIVFFDDILVYSPTLELHATHLNDVLHILATNSFFVKLSKCTFCSTIVDYLGHLITEGQLMADPAKLDAMVAWPQPRSAK